MPEWMDQALSTLRGLADAIPWQAVTENPVWKSVVESSATPAGLTLIGTILAAFAVGLLLGLFLRRQHRTGRQAPVSATEPLPAVEARETGPQAALRGELEGQGLPAREVNTRVRAFTARLGQIHETLEVLSETDPESEPLVRSAKQLLIDGNLEGAASYLEQARGRFSATSRLMADMASKRRLMAVNAAELAGDLHLARRGYGMAARLFGQAVDNLPKGGEREFVRLATKQATAEFRAGEAGKSAALLERVVQETARIQGAEHPAVAKALSRLAAARFALGEEAVAEDLYRRAYTINRKALGDTHPWVAQDINNLAQLMKRKGDLAAAEPLLRKALEIREQAFGSRHHNVRRTARDHIAVLRALDRPNDANAVLARLAAVDRRKTA